jgi:hypothetical protein
MAKFRRARSYPCPRSDRFSGQDSRAAATRARQAETAAITRAEHAQAAAADETRPVHSLSPAHAYRPSGLAL